MSERWSLLKGLALASFSGLPSRRGDDNKGLNRLTLLLLVCRLRLHIGIQSSSKVEQSAVNRWVVGSSPTFGATFKMAYSVYILENRQHRFYIGQTHALDAR